MKEKLKTWLVYFLTGVLSIAMALAFYVVFDIALTLVLNKTMDAELKSDWLEWSKSVYHYFRKKLG